ncbi:CocE/NonD family hydrolase [Gracilibacillus thailandensis]|uniref:CocE/NonD family hydrolase n=1 Tax=Gracilibacillus thailandensis TaxID=563735 RepID=A0A6N7R3E1_9BACI|nr:CocE/NonD family hydrolase [Gracilibacillus thailandensis]MRI67456.1 CocE/NonD family hydrolase [Gracilibacillus thailandensis]
MTKINQIIVEREVPCTLRDGITLYANIYRPQASGNYPVLLTRLPYNKNLPDFSHRWIDPIRTVMQGYIVIVQDVRGRFASEGEFEPFAQEIKDGYDTVEWAASLSYSNGKVGMFGLSYYAFTQLYALVEQPSALKAIFPAMTGNIFKEPFGESGVLALASAETWLLDSVAPDYLKRKLSSEEYSAAIKELSNDLDQIEEWHNYMPISELPAAMKHPVLQDIYRKYIDQNFNKRAVTQIHARNTSDFMNIPAYHLAGWYDNFLSQTLMNYQQMREYNSNQKLIIGPWGHGMIGSDLGERSFGVNSSALSIAGKEDLTSVHIQWFNHWLKEDNDILQTDEDPVKIFVMGINKWRSEKEWPLQRTVYTNYYFHSDGQANSKSGKLTTATPTDEPRDQFTHDPASPVPTHGGGTLFYNGRNVGPRDQRQIEVRDDVVVYMTPPLDESIEVTGSAKVILWASTDALDTDFTAKLVDVFPDGTAYNLADGIVRAKYQHGESVKNKIVCYEIELCPTSNVFLPGHSIRVDIASSDFPRYDVNPGTGKTTLDTVEMVKAAQKVFHQTEYPSHVILPIIPQ